MWFDHGPKQHSAPKLFDYSMLVDHGAIRLSVVWFLTGRQDSALVSTSWLWAIWSFVCGSTYVVLCMWRGVRGVMGRGWWGRGVHRQSVGGVVGRRGGSPDWPEAFQKGPEDHEHRLALWFVHYNFARSHKGLSNPYPKDPAMSAGLTNRIWTIEEIVRLADWCDRIKPVQWG